MCTITLWDGAAWDLQHCAHGDHVLCTVLSKAVLLRVMNCHLPLEAADGNSSMTRVLQLLSQSPAQQVALVVGDLKLDLTLQGTVQALGEAYAGGKFSEMI